MIEKLTIQTGAQRPQTNNETKLHRFIHLVGVEQHSIIGFTCK